MTPRAAVVAGFGAVLVLIVAVEVIARRPGSEVRPLGASVGALLRTRVGRVVVFAAWLWVGWHFLAR